MRRVQWCDDTDEDVSEVCVQICVKENQEYLKRKARGEIDQMTRTEIVRSSRRT